MKKSEAISGAPPGDGGGAAGMTREALIRAISGAHHAAALFVATPGALGAVNRIYGHKAGDDMLAAMVERMRRVAPPGAVIVRLAGAKFAFLAPAGSPEETQRLARIFARVAAAAPAGPSVDPRIGAAFSPSAAASGADFLIAAALGALDQARGTGSGFAVTVIDDDARKSETSLARIALDRIRAGAASVALQPVVAADEPGRVMFHEALIRVFGDDGEMIPAGGFMPQLERFSLTEDADIAALEMAFAELERNPVGRISVNLSGASIVRTKWADVFSLLATEKPDCATRLIVEVAEEAAIANSGAAEEMFALIRSFGSALALDDFGAGRTSFLHLRDFRFDVVKIDGGFIRAIDDNPDNQMLVSALVAISRRFDMMVVAEFVETAAEARVLRGLGVEAFQGFFFGRPALICSEGERLQKSGAAG